MCVCVCVGGGGGVGGNVFIYLLDLTCCSINTDCIISVYVAEYFSVLLFKDLKIFLLQYLLNVLSDW